MNQESGTGQTESSAQRAQRLRQLAGSLRHGTGRESIVQPGGVTAETMTPEQLTMLLNMPVPGSKVVLRSAKVNGVPVFLDEVKKEVRRMTGEKGWWSSAVGNYYIKTHLDKAKLMAGVAADTSVDNYIEPTLLRHQNQYDALGRNVRGHSSGLWDEREPEVTRHIREERVLERAAVAARRRVLEHLDRDPDTPISFVAPAVPAAASTAVPTQPGVISPVPGQPDFTQPPGAPPNWQGQPGQMPGTTNAPWWVQYPPPPWMGGPGVHYNYGAPPMTHAPQGGGIESGGNNEALQKEWWRLDAEMNKLNEELKNVGSVERARQIGHEWDALRRRQNGVANQLFAALDARIAAGRGAEGTPILPASAAEQANALSAVRGRTRDEAARLAAERGGGDQKTYRRWMSAFRRWPIRFLAMAPTGAAGVGAAALALKFLPASWTAALMLNASTPWIGGAVAATVGTVSIPALAVVAAAVTGAGLWHVTGRRLLGLHKVDAAMEKGWQAKKLYNAMEADDSKEAIDRKWKKINSLHKKILRWENLPRIAGAILGGALAGGVIADISAGKIPGSSGSSVRQGAINTFEFGKKTVGGAWGGIVDFWNNRRWPEWLKLGNLITPGSTPADHATARLFTSADIQDLQWNKERLEGLRIDDANKIGELDMLNRAKDEALERAAEKVRDANEALGAKSSVVPNPPLHGPPPAEPGPVYRPRAMPLPPPDIYTPPSFTSADVWPGGRGLRFSDLTFVIDEKTDVKSIPHGLRRLFDSIQFKGKAAEWLIDTIDKTTYNGYGGMRSGADVMQMLTDARTAPTKILDGTQVNLPRFLSNNLAANALEGSIENSKVLTTAEKGDVRKVLQLLEALARRGR